MSKNRQLAEDFSTLFAGLLRSHGRYIIPEDAKPDARGKIVGKGWTAKGTASIEDWENHLSGKTVSVPHGEETLTGTFTVGSCPIRDDATVVFGAADFDVYPLNLTELQASIKALGLPLVLCRSKSSGAHGYLFIDGRAPAELVRSKLQEWAVLLGYPSIEIFPKQTKLASENDYGDWINLPYGSGTRTTRYALDDAGKAVKVADFVAFAKSKAVTAQWLEAFQPTMGGVATDIDQFFEEGPPCLQALARRSFPEGSRNNALFSVAVYLKKRYNDDFGPHVADYNQRFMDPPLPEREVHDITKSVAKKNYSYRCKEQPIAAVCNRQLCVKRPFGIGGFGDDPGVAFGDLVKLMTEPPVWIWDVNGARIELTTEEIMDQKGLHKRVIEVLNVWPAMVRPPTWQEIVRVKLANAIVQTVPEDATREGQLWVHLSRFCTSKAVGRSLDELLLGKPFTDTEKQRTFFCSSDFLQYLQQHRVTTLSEKDLYRWLKRRDLEVHEDIVKGKKLKFWSVPAFTAQTEDFAVPRAQVKDAM